MRLRSISPRLVAILQALFVTMLWSTSWILIKFGLRNDVPPITFAGLRYTLAFLFLSPFVLFNPTQRQAIKQLSIKDWGKLALLGFIFYSLTQGAMFLTLVYLPANMLSLLLNLSSIFIGIAGIFILKEPPSLVQWAGIFLAAVGVSIYFIPVSFPQAQLLGIGIGLFCMFMNVISSLFSRAVNRSARHSALIVTFIPMGIGAVLMLITGLLIQGPGTLTGWDWLIIAWLALVNTALTFWMWNHALRILTAVESSVINSLMMPQTALLAFIFLGEGMSSKEIIGLVFVGLGTLIVQLKPRKTM